MLHLQEIGPEIPLGVLIAVALVIVFAVLLYAVRWLRRRNMESRAQHWTRVDATVYDSSEIDENASATSASTWKHLTNLDNDKYVSRWAIAIQYSYDFAGAVYTGIYFLPETWADGHLAVEAGKSWVGKKIVVRCNPHRPDQSIFLVEDGAPGEPHIPASLADQPYITTLPLK